MRHLRFVPERRVQIPETEQELRGDTELPPGARGASASRPPVLPGSATLRHRGRAARVSLSHREGAAEEANHLHKTIEAALAQRGPARP